MHRVASAPPGSAVKAAQLLRLGVRHPLELYDRLRAKYDVMRRRRSPSRAPYDLLTWDAAADRLAAATASSHLGRYSDEFAAIYGRLGERARSLREMPFPPVFDADPVLARAAYVIARLLKPAVAIETGVALGVTTACILSALARNGRGRLISVDLPPLGAAADAVGAVVPADLHDRWTLVRGTSTRVLPRLIAGCGPVGLFVQDSLFTWRNSTAEFRLVIPHLGPDAAVLANAVQHSPAFAWLTAALRPAVSAVVAAEGKPGELVGVCARTSLLTSIDRMPSAF